MPDVAGVLDHLGHFDGLADDRCVEFAVEGFQQVAGGLVQLADDGHGRVVVVLDRGTFAQELGVHRHAEVHAGLLAGAVFDDRDHHVVHGARQYGAAHHDSVALGLVAQGETDLAADAFDIVQFQVAILLARRADADEGHLGVAHGGADIGGSTQAAGLHALLQKFFQAGLDNGRLAIVDQVDLGRRNVDANNFMTTSREAAGAYCTNIAQTKDADSHRIHLVHSARCLICDVSVTSVCTVMLRRATFQCTGMSNTGRQS
ncbi:hypothetical protein D3C78_640920 [compost metagenome]